MPPTKTFAKPGLNSHALVERMQGRGLSVPLPTEAITSLDRIGYYRLLIYMRPLQDITTKRFAPGTSFEDILVLYEFDRQLRLLCLDAIERIEVALRSAIVQNLAVVNGPHFYLNAVYFSHASARDRFVNKVRGAEHLALTHYRNTYVRPPDPPIWAALEAVSFGVLSRLFADLSLQNRKLVARSFGYDEKVLVSWFRTLTVLRNTCAHHNRLWNFRFMAYQPRVAKNLSGVFSVQDTFHARAVVLVALLSALGHANDWKARFVSHVNANPAKIQPAAMGFPSNWQTNQFWL
jgi:abortive infection bacteriophage resistance protein